MRIDLEGLRKRRIGQWAVAYVAGGWLVLELLGFLAEQFTWPAGIVRAFIVVLAVGFFCVLVLAWYHGEQGRQRVSGPELLMVGSLLIVAAAAVNWVTRPRMPAATAVETAQGPPTNPRSIAILPFANLSSDTDLGFFTDGMHEEVISQLARIDALTRASPELCMRSWTRASWPGSAALRRIV